jgi:hypothetical protein
MSSSVTLLLSLLLWTNILCQTTIFFPCLVLAFQRSMHPESTDKPHIFPEGFSDNTTGIDLFLFAIFFYLKIYLRNSLLTH